MPTKLRLCFLLVRSLNAECQDCQKLYDATQSDQAEIAGALDVLRAMVVEALQ